ncbi:MAG: OmpA family protein [Pseudomonadota bacterium]
MKKVRHQRTVCATADGNDVPPEGRSPRVRRAALNLGAVAAVAIAGAPAALASSGAGLTATLGDAILTWDRSPVIRVQNGPLRPFEIRRRLLDRGFTDINFKKRRAPYEVEACRGGRLLSLTVGRRGRIRDRERIGRCGAASEAGREVNLRRNLRGRGFTRIALIRERRNATVFEACRGSRRVRLVVERDGEIRRRRRVGFCERNQERETRRERPRRNAVLSRDEVRAFLRQRRYRNISFVDVRDGLVVVEACRRLRKFRVAVDSDSRQISRRRRIGWCARNRNAPTGRIARPQIDFEARGRLRADVCQDAIEYLLDNDKIFFATASAELDDRSTPLLRRIARTANRCPGSSFVIGGHTDSRGSEEYNQDLSERRALSVARRLRRLGVPRNQISAVGYGESRPIATNASARGQALNRRIEMLVEWDRSIASR